MKSIIFVNFRWNCRGCNKTYPSRRQMECCHQVALGAIIRCIICNFDLPRSRTYLIDTILWAVSSRGKSLLHYSTSQGKTGLQQSIFVVSTPKVPLEKTTEHKTRKPFYEAGKTARNNNSATPGDISPLRSPSLSISLHGIHHSLIYSD